MDGWYNDDSSQLSSSTPSFPQNLFQSYKRSFCNLGSGVPGLAFKEGISYLELTEPESVASMEDQRQFYQGAGIKTAVFMGCRSGEIEIGTSSSSSSNINMEMEIKNLFTDDTIRQFQVREPRLPDYSRASSSSSSLRSLSVGSPEYSSLLISMGGASSSSFPPVAMPIPNIQLQSLESDDATMAKAMLAVLSSSSSSSSSYQPYQVQTQTRRQAGAFKRYISGLAPTMERKSNTGGQHLLKFSIARLRNIYNSSRRIVTEMQETRPTSNQLYHMISERKRREKLNEIFQVLRSLLPPGSKKDKASVLSNTREYLTSLKAEVSKLKEKNRLLETRLFKETEKTGEGSSSGLRADMNPVEVFESVTAEEERELEVRVTVKGEYELTNLVLQMLECIKKMVGMKLLSIDAETQLHQTDQTKNRTIMRLKFKAGEWDKSSLEETLTRAVNDLAR